MIFSIIPSSEDGWTEKLMEQELEGYPVMYADIYLKPMEKNALSADGINEIHALEKFL